ncbi:MAG: ferrous iron transport protein A [Lachnospiraceae bacterium]|nr:ferrous iron transport protein A [Lachnospiraceae bacterium]
MMPLTVLGTGERAVVRRIGGNQETRSHLADLGFVTDTVLSVIQSQDGNMIVNVKDSRLALTKEMASKIMVDEIAHSN